MQNEKSVEQIIGKRIQKIRQAKGYTQQQFAEVIGLSTNYLSDIERGKSSARLDKLVAIINALECSADDVFSDVIDFGYKVKSSRLSELHPNFLFSFLCNGSHYQDLSKRQEHPHLIL